MRYLIILVLLGVKNSCFSQKTEIFVYENKRDGERIELCMNFKGNNNRYFFLNIENGLIGIYSEGIVVPNDSLLQLKSRMRTSPIKTNICHFDSIILTFVDENNELVEVSQFIDIELINEDLYLGEKVKFFKIDEVRNRILLNKNFVTLYKYIRLTSFGYETLVLKTDIFESFEYRIMLFNSNYSDENYYFDPKNQTLYFQDKRKFILSKVY